MSEERNIVYKLVAKPAIKYVIQWDGLLKTMDIISCLFSDSNATFDMRDDNELVIFKSGCWVMNLSFGNYFTVDIYGNYGQMTERKFNSEYKFATN